MQQTPAASPWNRSRLWRLLFPAILAGILILMFLNAGTPIHMTASRDSKMNAGIIQLATLSSQVRTTYSDRSSYGSGSMVPALLAANAVPPDMRITNDTANLRNAWGGATAVAAINSGTRFTITFEGVPADGCVRLPTINSGSLGGAFAAVSINGTDMTMPVEIAPANAACEDRAAGNALTFTYR